MSSPSNYGRATEAIQVPNLTGKVEISRGEHFAALKAGEIAATHTKYADGELAGYTTVQSSSYFGANLVLAALRRIKEGKVEVDEAKLIEAMYEVMQEAQIEAPLLEERGDHAA